MRETDYGPRGPAIDAMRHEVGEHGFTVKVGWIDNDPTGRLNGIRLLSARALFWRAISIQIFDRETVTLSWGFTNDDSVSLTKEDGRLFLEWLRDQPNTPLVPALWEIIPAPDPGPITTSAATTNMAKARLVDYLVSQHADIFGRYGSMTAEGEDFYEAVLKLIQNPERDGRDMRRLIHAIESLANAEYSRANRLWRADIQANRYKALGAVLAAESLRECAASARANMGAAAPPPAEFPEAITAEFALGRLHSEATSQANSIPIPDRISPGATVVIRSYPNFRPNAPEPHPRAGQIGTVTHQLPDGRLNVRFTDDRPEETFSIDEVTVL